LHYQKEEILKKSIPMNNSFQALKQVMRHLGVGYSSSFLEELVTAHPEPDSLLAVSDALVKYKIENFAVQLSSENLDQIPTPFVVQMNGEAHAYFSCVSDVTAEGVRLLDEKGRSEVLSTAMNYHQWVQ
jgi:ABC-type bacteriocin/lantibiotic exporter with double-glycine peptidase domain